MEGQPRGHIEHESAPALPQKGTEVRLTKLSLLPGKESEVAIKESLEGVLVATVRIGSPIELTNGSRTTAVRNIEAHRDHLTIETETSRYTLEAVFEGLSLNSSLGSVSLPSGTMSAQLIPGNALEYNFRSASDAIHEVRIDRDALKDVLLQSPNGGVVHILGSRYMVLAKVGSAHLPFYRSSSGTDGKNAGEWYPFFGHTGDWIIKGDVNDDGSMSYSDEITRVNDLLNAHLHLPPTEYIGRDFTIRNSAGEIKYDLSEQIPVADLLASQYFRQYENTDAATAAYVTDLTGYNPVALKGYHPSDRTDLRKESAREWREQIVEAIKKQGG